MATLFTPSWVGTNGDPWPSSDWPTTGEDSGTNTALDILSNKGRMAVHNTNDEYVAAVGPAATNVKDSSVLLRVSPEQTSGDNFWLYVCFRSSGDIQAGAAGRPTSAYYFRFDIAADSRELSIYVRNSNTESSALASGTLGHTIGSDFWIRAECLDEGADVRLRCRTWTDGNSEGGTWDFEDLHAGTGGADGTKITTAGKFQLVARNTNSGTTADKEADIDSLTLSDFDAGGGDTTIIVDMAARRFRRIAV